MSGTQRLLIGALLLLGSGVAAAEQNDAKARYLSGQSHYNLNEFSEALQDFKEAYRLRPDAAFLFNIAQCERQLGDLEEAIKFYRSYLRNKPDATNKREVEHKIDEMRGLIEAKKKATTGAPQSVIPPAAVEEPPPGRGPAPAHPSEPTPLQPPPPTASPPPPPPPSSSSSPSSSSPPLSADPMPLTSSSTTTAPGADLTVHASDASGGAAPQPIYRKWWFWAGTGAVVLGLGVLAAVALSGGSSPPSSGLGNQKVF